MSFLSFFESPERLFEQEVRTIFEEITFELESTLTPEELFTFQSLEAHLAADDKRQSIGQEFGRSMNALHVGQIVEHTVDGDTQEIVQGMGEGDQLGGLHHNDTTTTHLDEMLADDEADVVNLLEEAVNRAQSREDVWEDFHSREAA